MRQTEIDDSEEVKTTEQGEQLTRWTYKDGEIGWKLSDRFLTDYEQDSYEEAYQMGWQARFLYARRTGRE